MERFHIKLEFMEPILGTAPKNEELYRDYIASKAPQPELADEEMETVPVIDENKLGTGFHRDDGGPFLYDYNVKGFFKDAAGMLRRVKGSKSSKLKAYKKLIDGLVFVKPRRIHLHIPAGSEISILERPLRASTPQGERVALARSEVAPAGTWIEFDVLLLDDGLEPVLREWLEYGQLRGLGQWRNAGYGRFRIAEFEEAK